MSQTRYDCIIVGARAAGAAAALLLARRGLRILVLDDGVLGSDTLSTHFIWPQGARRLEAWGLLPKLAAHDTPPIRRIAFDPGCALVNAELDVAAWCPRRTVLDRLLVEAALAVGAEVRHQTRVLDLVVDRGRVVGVRHQHGSERAALVVGADGRHSTVGRLTQAEVVEARPPQTGGFYAYFDGLPMDGVQFWLRQGWLTYAWPTNEGLSCVYIAAEAGAFDRLRERLRHGFAAAAVTDSGLIERLRAARRVSPAHGFAHQGPARRRRCGPGWALIGDAASFKDPAAGMGISEAFEDAVWLDEQAATRSLHALDPALRDLETGRIFGFCATVAELRAPEPWLAEIYREVAADPIWSRELIRMLGGEVAPPEFFATFAGRAEKVPFRSCAIGEEAQPPPFGVPLRIEPSRDGSFCWMAKPSSQEARTIQLRCRVPEPPTSR